MKAVVLAAAGAVAVAWTGETMAYQASPIEQAYRTGKAAGDDAAAGIEGANATIAKRKERPRMVRGQASDAHLEMPRAASPSQTCMLSRRNIFGRWEFLLSRGRPLTAGSRGRRFAWASRSGSQGCGTSSRGLCSARS